MKYQNGHNEIKLRDKNYSFYNIGSIKDNIVFRLTKELNLNELYIGKLLLNRYSLLYNYFMWYT